MASLPFIVEKFCLILGLNSLLFFLTVNSEGCTAPLIFPDKPFVVVWNHPSRGCENRGIHLGFEKWGIVDNPGDMFLGKFMDTLYKCGDWPYYRKGIASNGGIPQLGDLKAHLKKVRDDVKRFIRDPAFSGLSAMDFEAWRPLFHLNYDSLKIYQEKSMQLAQKKFPSYIKEQLRAEATKEFEEAARSFMEDTLRQSIDLRPSGRWGYYGYPRYWSTHQSTIDTNDKYV